jgi:predicted DNA-binding transcriptional regulator AlpA
VHDQSFEPLTRTNNALTERDTAKWLGLTVATLRAWRHRGTGPQFRKFGRAVRYLQLDVHAFIEASRVDTRQAVNGPAAATTAAA